MKKEGLKLDLKDIQSKIQEEYENFRNHKLFKTQETLVSRFDKLYEFFKIKPNEGIKAEELVGKVLATDLTYYCRAKGTASQSVRRIKEAYEAYRKSKSSDVDFVFTYEHYSLHWIEKRKGLKYLLNVYYKDINYNDILVKYSEGADSGDGITVKVRLDFFPFKLRAFVVEYLRNVVLDHRYLEIKGFGILPFREINIELDEIYTSVQANIKVPSSASSHITSYKKRHPEIPYAAIPERKNFKEFFKQQAKPVENILQDAFESRDLKKRHIVILGSPGSGKSTVLSFLALSLANGSSKNLNLEGFLPLFINLKDYVNNCNTGLIKFGISTAIQDLVDDDLKSGIKSSLKHSLASCSDNREELCGLVIILDALDETGNSKARVVKEIEKIRNRYQKVFIIVSSRTINYYESPLRGFNVYQLERLQHEDIKNIVRSWFKLLSKKYSDGNLQNNVLNWSDRRSSYIINKIFNSPNLLDISRKPLYLTYLILLGSDPIFELPNNLNDLYFKFFNKLIRNWEKKHKISASKYLFNFYLEGFIEVCWIVHRALFGNRTNDNQIIQLFKYIKTSTTSNLNQLIDFLLKAGIFEIVQDSDQNEFLMPTHLSFLDYGFAHRLADMWDDLNIRSDLWKDLKIILQNEYLIDCLGIFISQLKDPMSFLERVLNEPNDLFYRNHIFLARILNLMRKDPRITKIVKTMLQEFYEIYKSKSEFTNPIKPDILKSIYLLDGIDILIKLFEIEPDQKLLNTILDYISLLNDKTAIPHLKYFYHLPISLHVKTKICCCISKLGDPDLAISLIRELNNNKIMYIWPMTVISLSLYQYGDRKLIPLLNELLNSEIELIDRMHILLALTKFSDRKEALSLFKEQYKKGIDIDSKNNIIETISRCRRLEAIPLLLGFYKERNTERMIKIKILDAFYILGGSKNISLFKELFEFESDHKIRFQIAKLIGYLGDTDIALPILKEHYYKTKSFKEKVEIAQIIGWFKETRLSIKMLKELYQEKEANSYLKTSILISIYRYGDPDFAISRMKEIYNKEKNPYNKRYIVFLLGYMGKKKLAKSLFTALFEEEVYVGFRADIAYLLGQIGDKEKKLSLSLLEKAYKDTSNMFIKSRIARHIGEYGNQKTIPILKNMYDNENNLYVRVNIAEAIYEISKKVRVLVFRDKKEKWEIFQIPKKYSI